MFVLVLQKMEQANSILLGAAGVLVAGLQPLPLGGARGAVALPPSVNPPGS